MCDSLSTGESVLLRISAFTVCMLVDSLDVVRVEQYAVGVPGAFVGSFHLLNAHVSWHNALE
jgi:hypothetical protein